MKNKTKKVHEGNLIIQKEYLTNYKDLTEVSGSIDVIQGATLDAPNLTKFGSIYVYEGATLDAPNLTEVSGHIYVRQGATLDAPNLTKSGSIYVRQGATLDAPNLTKSGSIYVIQGATLKINVIRKLKWKPIDGSLFVIESEKTSKGIKIFSGYNVYNIEEGVLIKKPCYVSEKDGFTAHGDTVKKSIQDLEFKIISEKLKKEPIEVDTMININHYRLLTGACEFGVKSWMEENNMTEESYRADKLLPILEKTNAYGLESFKKLINF